MNEKNDRKAIKYALATVLFWSTVATAFKIGLFDLHPSQLIFIASLTSLVVLAVAVLIAGKAKLLFSIPRKTLVAQAALGFLNPFLYYLILFKTYSLLPAQVAQPINMVWPIVLVLLSVPLLKRKIGYKSIIALLISFVGVLFISSQGKYIGIDKSDTTGLLLGISSAFIWALYWIFNLKSPYDDVVKLFYNFLFGTLFLLIYVPIVSGFAFEWNKSLAAAVYIGVFEVGISFIFWFKALSLSTKHARIANLVYIAPFLSLIFIRLILKEDIYLSTLLGIVFIITGILYQQTDKTNK